MFRRKRIDKHAREILLLVFHPCFYLIEMENLYEKLLLEWKKLQTGRRYGYYYSLVMYDIISQMSNSSN
jgi:hypothetical protein